MDRIEPTSAVVDETGAMLRRWVGELAAARRDAPLPETANAADVGQVLE